MQAVRYTEDQILYGLREFWKYRFGSYRPIDLDTRIDLQIISDNGWDDDDLDEVISALPDLFSDLAKYFGFECSIEEWKKELGIQERIRCLEEWERDIAPHFTFAALVRFIEKRATAVLFQPVVVIDKECRPAGVFYGIQQITKDVVDESSYFGPSTKIIDVLRGYELETFWSQLNWMTEYRIPQLSFFWSRIDEYCCCLYCLGFSLTLLATGMTQQFTYLIAIPICALMACFFSSLYKNRINPLPPEFVTFRDLAILIAEQDCDAVRN